LSPTDLESLRPAGPGWFLVGDAAGLVDPITREGIYFALLSAEWAADTIASAPAGSCQPYAARVREEIGSELILAARLKRRFFRPQFTSLLIDALRHSASVRNVMADLVSGEQGYRNLTWRLAKTLQIGLASRVFFSRIGRPREPRRTAPALSGRLASARARDPEGLVLETQPDRPGHHDDGPAGKGCTI
jgi:flavin-dependent dehydrogenase